MTRLAFEPRFTIVDEAARAGSVPCPIQICLGLDGGKVKNVVDGDEVSPLHAPAT
jgi:hypothetical protein